MGQHTCKTCGLKGHSDKTCGKVDSSLSAEDRNNLLTSLNAKANRSRRNEDVKRYRRAHPERVKESSRKSSEKLRLEVLTAYGAKCACCGYDDLTTKLHGKSFLQIDHISGNGRQHKKEIGFKNFYQWLKQQNFPNGFRVLCRGCNNSMCPGENKCLLHKK